MVSRVSSVADGAINSSHVLQHQIRQQVEHCYCHAESQLRRHFPRPLVNFQLRGRAAGTAHLQLNKLRFNPILLQENPATFVAEVVPHEVCHLLSFQLYGRVKPHGPEWRQLMQQLFQLTGETTHSFDLQSVKRPGFQYCCHCGPVELSIRRHNKVVRGEAQYRCRRCGQWLRPMDVAQNTGPTP